MDSDTTGHRLEDYWGVGPKTRATLEDAIGREAAVEAIEDADIGRLVEAGVPRGRATRILRRATGGDGIDSLATRDARSVYDAILDRAVRYAVTEGARDRIRVLTPLEDREVARERLDAVVTARDAWAQMDDAMRERVLEIFETYDDRGRDQRAAVQAVLGLQDAGVTTGPFAAVSDLDPAVISTAADALGALGDSVDRGVDEELDRLRESHRAVEELDASAMDVVEDVRSGGGPRDAAEFREAFVERVLTETDVDPARIRAAAPDRAADAADFVGEGLRTLAADLREAREEREATVRETLQSDVEGARTEIDRAVDVVEESALALSLGRFAAAFDMTRPTVTDETTVAIEGARNLDLAAGDRAVQPVSYALGDHETGVPTDGERVAVLTGANSGGKTTLLETVCQVVVMASMGLPVPAEHAVVTTFDDVVFHRRHASFNAGVLESTLQSIVPPLTGDGRTLMLVDEFEAITEPGSAADLLHGLVRLTVDREAVGAFVTHLASDLEPLPENARVDGIVAEGLNADLELDVDYQPRFGELGRSTPEFIVSRLVANAPDRTERSGFETLAESLGQEVVQRTLSDAWDERD
ncbi:MAG: DNA mismatch repair protein [Halanaeroarchaeum sp.]